MSRLKILATVYAIFFSLAFLYVLLLMAPRPVSAEYVEVEATRLPIPSFDVLGTVPLTQLGAGVANQGKSKGSGKLHSALAKIIPLDWNYFLSENAPLCSPVVWDESKQSSWVQSIQTLAEETKARILIDWNYKTILVASGHEKGVNGVYINPRSGMANTLKINLPANSPIHNISLQEASLSQFDCKPRINPFRSSEK